MMASIKSTLIVILLFTLPILCTTYRAYSQSENGKLDFFLKVNAGPLFGKNTIETAYESKVGASFGSYLSARYNFSRFGISAGIGAESFTFSDGIDLSIAPNEVGYYTLKMNYLAVGIPVLLHYSLSDRFDIYGGMNVLGVNWMSFGYGGSGPQNSDLEMQRNDNIPNWQFSQEVMVGVNYDLSQRFTVGCNLAKSMGAIQGMEVGMEFTTTEGDNFNRSQKFEYAWTRVNLELAYRLNK